jgi:hypothetical protein
MYICRSLLSAYILNKGDNIGSESSAERIVERRIALVFAKAENIINEFESCVCVPLFCQGSNRNASIKVFLIFFNNKSFVVA